MPYRVGHGHVNHIAHTHAVGKNAFDVGYSIYVRSLAFRPADGRDPRLGLVVFEGTQRVDHHGEGHPQQPAVDILGAKRQDLREPVQTLDGHSLSHSRPQRGPNGPFLRTVYEAARVVKADVVDKVEKVLELLIRLPGKAPR